MRYVSTKTRIRSISYTASGSYSAILASIGVQDGGSQYTTYSCDLPGSYNYQTIHWTPQSRLPARQRGPPPLLTSPTDTPTPTATATCEPSWVVVDHPSAGPGESHFNDVAAISANDVWAVGSFGDSSNYYQTLTEHWDGTAWSVVNSPDVSTFVNVLTGVSAVASDDVWAVGWYNTTGSNAQNMTMHWNGSQWSLVSSPAVGTNSRLNSVVAISADDVWAVGYSGASTYQALAIHWNGTAWSVVWTPNVGTGSNALNGVAAIASNDVWAVRVRREPPPNSHLALGWQQLGSCFKPKRGNRRQRAHGRHGHRAQRGMGGRLLGQLLQRVPYSYYALGRLGVEHSGKPKSVESTTSLAVWRASRRATSGQ